MTGSGQRAKSSAGLSSSVLSPNARHSDQQQSRLFNGRSVSSMKVLRQYQGTREKKLRLSDVKEMFLRMKDHVGRPAPVSLAKKEVRSSKEHYCRGKQDCEPNKRQNHPERFAGHGLRFEPNRCGALI
jgi:hypothetical protein